MSKRTPWHEDPSELRKRRQALGISQAELAARTGVSRSLVREVEGGRVKLRGELRNALWKAVGMFQMEADRALETIERWAGQVAEGRRQHADFDEVMERAGGAIRIPPKDPKKYAAWLKSTSREHAALRRKWGPTLEAAREIVALKVRNAALEERVRMLEAEVATQSAHVLGELDRLNKRVVAIR